MRRRRRVCVKIDDATTKKIRIRSTNIESKEKSWEDRVTEPKQQGSDPICGQQQQ